MNNSYATKLYTNPSVIGGVATLLDLGNTLMVYNDSDSEVEADNKAISSDWKAVGQDIKNSIPLGKA